MASQKAEAGMLPVRVLSGVAWTFDGEPAGDRARFEAEVRRAQGNAQNEMGAWRPEEVVLPCPRVRIDYMGMATRDAHEYTRESVELASDDGRAFAAGELLFKLHNAVVQQLRHADHRHFEGLTRKGRADTGGVPTYEMEQGS